MPKKPRVKLSNILTITIAVLLPISLIVFFGWYFGFLFSYVEEYNDPCLLFYNQSFCESDDSCKWNKKSKVCKLDSECSGAGQQNCGEGCHWDATVKKPGSNLYGLCRPATLAKEGDAGAMELK